MARGVRPELWDRLDRESARLYEQFKCYLYQNPAERSILGAYRVFAENPEAKRLPGQWSEAHKEFAWEDRARAYDAHIERIRRKGMEKAIEDEARKQATTAERNRFRLNELMTMGFEEASRWLEEIGYEGMRASDVVQLIRLHLDYADRLGGEESDTSAHEWTEDDDDFVEGVLAEIESISEESASLEDGPDSPPESAS